MELTISRDVKAKRTVLLALSAATLLVLGLIYAFSMFASPISEAFGLERSAVGLTFNIMMIAFCVGALIGSQLNKLIGLKLSLVVSAVLFLVGFAGTGLLGSGSLPVLYIFYGAIGGIAVGIAYNTLIATTNLWFPDKVGFSSGVMMMGFGLGSLILGTLSVRIAEVTGIATVLIGIGVVGAVVVLALASQMAYPPFFKPACAADKQDLAPHECENIMTTPIFYTFWVWAIIFIAIGLATIGNASSDAQLVGIEVGFATLLVGLVSTTNGVSRIIIGMIFDRIGVKGSMAIIGTVGAIAAGAIIAAFMTGTSALYIAGALLCGFTYGGVPVISSAFARTRFGATNYPLNLSLTNFSIALGSILNVVVAFAVGSGDRLAVFTVMIVLAFIALASIIPFSKMWGRDMARVKN